MQALSKEALSRRIPVTATSSTVFVVEIEALHKLLAEKDAEIEQLKEYVTQADEALFEFGKHAGEIAGAKDAEIERLKMLMKHAKDFLQYVLETYGKSVYQIELEVACATFIADDGPGKTRQDAAEGAAKRAWEDARIFIESMKRNYEARQRSP